MAAALNPDRPARAADPAAASPAAASSAAASPAAASPADAAPAADAAAYPAEPVQHYFDVVYGDDDATDFSHEHLFMFDDLINGNVAALFFIIIYLFILVFFKFI